MRNAINHEIVIGEKAMSKRSDYLKNELRNYLHIKNMLDNDLSIYDNKIKRCNDQIKEIDEELSCGDAKGISYDHIPSSNNYNQTLQLIYNQDKQIELIKEYEGLMLEEKDSYCYRIKYIEDCFDKLTEYWEIAFVSEYYCKGISIENIKHKDIHYSSQHLYRCKDSIIEKMLS